MQVKSKAKYIRISPRKVRLVAQLIQGMDVEEARLQLQFLSKRVTQPILKLLNSAISNAKQNFSLEENNLYIAKIIIEQGPTLRRWRARAFGRAAPIRKRSSHITLVLDEKVETKKKPAKKEKIVEPVEKKEEKKETVEEIKEKEVRKPAIEKRVPPKPEKKKISTQERLAKLGKRIFRRKSV